MTGKMVEEAYEFIIKGHKGQYRKGWPLPYSVHVVEVMKRVFGYGRLCRNDEILSASLLHDYIEDVNKENGFDVLKEKFSPLVATLVLEMSRPEGDNANELEKLAFMRTFKDKSILSVIIKIADRVSNVNDYYTADRHIYASWYALQAYPLIQRYYESLKDEDLDYIKDDIDYLNHMIIKNYDIIDLGGFDSPDIEKILSKRPKE